MPRLLLVMMLATIASATSFPQSAAERPFSIKGQVLDHESNPVQGAVVRAYLPSFKASDGRFPETTSGADGRFSIGVPRVGTYTFMVENARNGFPSTYYRFYFPHNRSRPDVIVAEGETAPTVTLRLPERPGRIEVRIADSTSGRVIPESEIRLCRLEAPNYCFTTKARSESGRFRLSAIAAPFSVHVSADGFEDSFVTVPSGVSSGSIKDLEIAMTKALSVAGDSLPAPQVIFPTDGSDLYGFPRVTRLQWSPVSGAKGYAVDIEVCQGSTKDRVCTGSMPLQHPSNAPTSGIEATNFEFTFVGTQPGRWRVWALDNEGRPGRRSPWITFFYPPN